VSSFSADSEDSNPFSTRYIRPEAIEFLAPAGTQVEDLVQRLRRQQWWGEIVGPHGSGKSTLLAAMQPALNSAGMTPRLVTLHRGDRSLGLRLDRQLAGETRLIVVDGYEQLGAWARWRLKRFCRSRGLGLLVTSHRRTGMPSLVETRATLPQAQAIVEQLQRGRRSLVAPQDVARSFANNDENLREMLLDLYDVYEARRGREE